MAPTKGFRVDPGKLLAVADQVHRLLEDMSGGSGYVAGNLPRYREQAAPEKLTAALASFWSGEDVFATAYGYEHGGVVITMQRMVEQLTNLESACRTTAEQYQSRDTQSSQQVTQSGTAPNTPWVGATP
ncbi:MAG: WXG100 family type VII secretion target [Jatrophihabitantaceae bacterium]